MNSPALVTGRCACGAVRYEAAAQPGMGLHCHCRDCQRATGSGHSSMALFPRAAFTLHGELEYHTVKTDSGHSARRGWCRACGSPMVAEPGAVPHLIGVFAASLDDLSVFAPRAVLYRKRAAAWDLMDLALPAFEAMMPPPPEAGAGGAPHAA